MKKTVILLMVMMVSIDLLPAFSYAKVPGIKAKKSAKNILKLTKKYDRDAYHILKTQKKRGDRIAYWVKPGRRIVDKIDTCVHEEFHMYVFMTNKLVNGSTGFGFYRGKGKVSYVAADNYFRTELATKKIPKKLRTFRYNIYVSKGSNASSNVMGHVGLLNEFCAYYWGTRVMYKLYPYMKKHVKNASGWSPFVTSYLDGREAYAEFYYWTLKYLRYAKVKKPKLYKKILKDKGYVRTIHGMSAKFRKLNRLYRNKLDKISRRYNGRSFGSCISHGRFRLGKYIYPVRPGYAKLKKQIASKKFSKIKKDIKKAAGK